MKANPHRYERNIELSIGQTGVCVYCSQPFLHSCHQEFLAMRAEQDRRATMKRYIVWVIDIVTNKRDKVHVDAASREEAFNQAEKEFPDVMAYDAQVLR